MRAVWMIVLFAACGSVNMKRDPDPDASPGTSGDAGSVDAAPSDATQVPTADANPCFGTGLVKLCLDELPREPLVIATSKQIDTDHDSRCASFTPANTEWCVITATTLTIAKDATLSAIGGRAFVLIATEALQIDGTLDVSSHQTTFGQQVHGAGAQSVACFAGGGSSGADVQGGGFGGSFGFRGGSGGIGPSGGSRGGVSPMPQAVTKLRSGCGGSMGAFLDSDTGFGGEAGDGGGAVYVITPSITVSETGVVRSSGAGGRRSPTSQAGAGGGGSGGMVGFEATTLVLKAGARLSANGGGGGEGGGCAGLGANGQESMSPTVPALGGRVEASGGNGGDGAFSTGNGEPGANGLASCTGGAGGGGGGGGGGVILLLGAITDSGAHISPPAKLTL